MLQNEWTLVMPCQLIMVYSERNRLGHVSWLYQCTAQHSILAAFKKENKCSGSTHCGNQCPTKQSVTNLPMPDCLAFRQLWEKPTHVKKHSTITSADTIGTLTMCKARESCRGLVVRWFLGTLASRAQFLPPNTWSVNACLCMFTCKVYVLVASYNEWCTFILFKPGKVCSHEVLNLIGLWLT